MSIRPFLTLSNHLGGMLIPTTGKSPVKTADRRSDRGLSVVYSSAERPDTPQAPPGTSPFMVKSPLVAGRLTDLEPFP